MKEPLLKLFDPLLPSDRSSPGSPASNERGSFIVAAILFMFIFLMIGGFAVDLSSYYNKQSKLDNMADSVVLAGGRALQQYTDNPDTVPAYRKMRTLLKERQGGEKLETYPNADKILGTAFSEDARDGIVVRKLNTNCGSRNVPSDTRPIHTDPNGDTHNVPSCYESKSNEFFLVGVMTLDHFAPTFMPIDVVGVDRIGMHSIAVARVEPAERQKRVINTSSDTANPECGMYVDQTLKIKSNNFNKNVLSPRLDFCASGDNGHIKLTDDAKNADLGEINVGDCTNGFEDNGKNNSHAGCDSDAQAGVPKLKDSFTDSSTYIESTNVTFSAGRTDGEPANGEWDQGPCTSGYSQMETDDGNELTWSNTGEAVCVSNGSSDFKPYPEGSEGSDPVGGSPGQIQVSGGGDANIHVTNGNVNITGGGGLTGDLYAENGNVNIDGGGQTWDGDIYAGKGGGEINIETNQTNNNNVFNGAVFASGSSGGNINVQGNNHVFNGGENGVSLWADNGDNITFANNNYEIYGVMGTGGDGGNVKFDSSGGGNLTMHGISLVSGNYTWKPNSGSTEIKYDDEQFNLDILDMGNWDNGEGIKNPEERSVKEPLFASVKVSLIE